MKLRGYCDASCGNVMEGDDTGNQGKKIKSLSQNVKKVNLGSDYISVEASSVRKYSRGALKVGDDNERRSILGRTKVEMQRSVVDSATNNALAEILFPAETGFLESEEKKAFKITQKELKEYVDENASGNILDLNLPELGPYLIKYSRNGKYQLFGGRKGHLAIVDCHNRTVKLEMQLQEALFDIQYLHDESLFAVAQKKYVYLYDTEGVEIHCMKRHERPYALDFLPQHFLLVTMGHSGWIKWHDVSTGQFVGGHSSGYGPCNVLTHNPQNAVSLTGHSNGTICLWSPISCKSLVSVLAHQAPISDIAINKEGTSMITSGLDGFMKVWDLRMYKQLHALKQEQPVITLDLSDTGLLAVGVGRSVHVMKDVVNNPFGISYLQHELNFCGIPNASMKRRNDIASQKKNLSSNVSVCSVKFRPFEDVLSIGHSHGISNIVVPGSGEVNVDSYESNPFADLKQRRETEVKSLLRKLEPRMIEIGAQFTGSVNEDENREMKTANKSEPAKINRRQRARGRNRISAKLRRKQSNILDASIIKLKQKMLERSPGRSNGHLLGVARKSESDKSEGDALARFILTGAPGVNVNSSRRDL